MKRLQRLLLAATLAATLAPGPGRCQTAPATTAGPTYRIVGPDGKVTYSDRKPTDPQLKTRELGKTVNAPLLAPVSEPFDLHPAASLTSVNRAAHASMLPSDGVAPPVDISGKPFPPGLPEAIFDVMMHQFFVQTLVENCSRLQPAFAERYQGAVRNWRNRNADILATSNRVAFTRFSAEQRDVLRATARTRLAQLLAPATASDAEKVAWCELKDGDLVRHQMELVGDARLAPLAEFDTP